MEVLKKYIESAAMIEKYEAIDKYGLFHSLHEAYAVALEEWQEAKAEMTTVGFRLNDIWEGTREDSEEEVFSAYCKMYNRAILAACECVQLAAVAQKALEGVKQCQ